MTTAEKTALLVIDVQESFRHRAVWEQCSNPDIVEDVSRLVDHARAVGQEVIWVLHSQADGGPFDPDWGFVRLQEGLTARPGEAVITKSSINSFTTTNLQQLLTQKGVGRLLIAGIQTEQCCETTTRVAADLGYDVTFVTDATATFPITRPDTGEVRAVADVIAGTEFSLAGRFATIATIDQVVGEVIGEAVAS
ncbi:cysteine hydrolase family protein [Nocardioides speluncae]|uniref:cysteine hydrolase family protein n=1 Tax=Nocardioides speluncae TaxID=2670337 RepID=UPI000D68F80A|nr:cysteine hydrolase family protein [Nocardioides speluncae]